MLCSMAVIVVLETAVIYFLSCGIPKKNNIRKLTASHLSGSIEIFAGYNTQEVS